MHVVNKTPYTITMKFTPGRRVKGFTAMTPERIGQKLVTLRNFLGLTQVDMSELITRLGGPELTVGLRQYQRWEKGQSMIRVMSPEFVFHLAEVLAVPVYYFLSGTRGVPYLYREASPVLNSAPEIPIPKAEGERLVLYRVVYKFAGSSDRHNVLILAMGTDSARAMLYKKYKNALVHTVRPVKWEAGIVR